jgi:hypothetical protein
VGVEASRFQQQVFLINNDQKILDSVNKQNILGFVPTAIRSMEHQKQSEDFDRPVSRTGGDMFSVNGHFNGNETQKKSPEPQTAASDPAKIPPLAPPEQKVPVPTHGAPFDPRNPQPFEAKASSALAAHLDRPPSATHSVVGPDVQRSIPAVSRAEAGELHKIPSAASSVISGQIQMPQSAPSSVNAAGNEKPLTGASRVIAADIEWPPTVAQKSESSKVMNGVAVKPAEGIKNGHPVGANKEEDDDNDVIIMRSPDTISSSSEGVVVEGNTRKSATDEAQRAGKSLFIESRLAENLRLETKANTVADTVNSVKKQELEDSEGKDVSLKNIEGKNISGKEWKNQEDKEKESQKNEHLKDEEMMRKSTESLKDSWKKEPEKMVERNSVPRSEQMEKETAKNKESLNTASYVTSQPVEMKDSKPADSTADITCQDNEQVIKETQKCVSPENVAEISKKGSVQAEEKAMEIKEGFKNEEAKTEYSSKLQENDNVKTGNLLSIDDEEIKKGSTQQKEESKDETLGESYKKLIEGSKKGSPKKEETKETERREDAIKNESEIKTLEKSTKEKEEETMKGWAKKEEGRDVRKVEDTSKEDVEEIKGFPKKENEVGNSSEANKREVLEGKAETLITKKEQSLKVEAEDAQKKKKEEIEIVKKAESMKKENASRKDTEGTPKEKKSEKTSPCGVENELVRPGGTSPAPSKPTRPKSKSSAVSESTTSRKTSRTTERPTSGPKELTTTIAPDPEVEKSPRTKTPKDLGESKLKRRSAKKRESQSLDEVAKKQGNGTASQHHSYETLVFH